VTILEVEPTAVAAGGDAIGRGPDGRVVFVEGALPGERVRAEITAERKDFLRSRAVEVLVPSVDRVEPPCPHVAAGCGGCQWQHIDVRAQHRLKADVVADALRRIAHLPDAPIAPAVVAVPAAAYRTSLRLAVDGDGRAVFRGRHGHDTIAVGSCLVSHPRLEELVAGGRFPGATEVTLRVSAATGERVALVRPSSAAAVVSDDVLLGGRIHEVAGGRTWRLSATSFFQSGPAAADALVRTVSAGIGDALDGGGVLVDAYAGVGLLGGAAATAASGSDVRVVAVESHPPAVRDARSNLRDLDAKVIQADVTAWQASGRPAAAVIADPARAGLGRAGTAALVAARAPVLVLVSCDPASLARDTTLLVEAGYRLDHVTVLDLFPHTFHVETVSRFVR
jgi:23S rRNA (uracil1939-C5)-methyltransferase